MTSEPQAIGSGTAAVGMHGLYPAEPFFHGLSAALVLTSIPIGLTMVNVPNLGPTGHTLFHLHRSIGALVLVITVFRLLSRLRHPAPPLPAEMPAWQQSAARGT